MPTSPSNPQVLPLENKMKNPHHFKRIIILGMAVIVSTYSVFGCLGYLVYGSDICPSITLNLTSTRIIANTSVNRALLYDMNAFNCLYCFALLCLAG